MLRKFLFLLSFLFCTLPISAQTPPPPPPPADYQGPVIAPASTPSPENRYTVMGTPVEGGAKNIAGGVLNGKAISLPKPAYPLEARAARAHGAVTVQVLIDEEGKVVSAKAISGPPLLHQAASDAALKATFQPTRLSGQPVKVSGVITYNFVFDTKMKDVAINWGMYMTLLRSPDAESILSRPVATIAKFMAATVPPEMSESKTLFEELAAAAAADRPVILNKITEAFRLRAGKEDLWRFEVGLAMGRLRLEFEWSMEKHDKNPQAPPDLSGMYRELREIKKLSVAAPEEVPEPLQKAVADVAAFADSLELGAVMDGLADAAEKVR